MGLGSVNPHSGNKNSLRLQEVVQFFSFAENPDEWIQVRFIDKLILPVKRHWINILAGKDKKKVQVPRFSTTFNPDNEDEPFEGTCPYSELSTGDEGASRVEFFYLVNAIIRDIQEDEPARKVEPSKKEAKSGYKDIKSKSWSPVRVIRLTNGMVARLQELGETNVVKNKSTGQKKAFPVDHPKYGVDINIKYKPNASGAQKYSMDKVEGRTPLSDEEKEYLIWELKPSLLDECGRMSIEQAEDDLKKMEIVGGEEVEDDEDDEAYNNDDDDDDIPLGKGSKKRSSKSKSKTKSKPAKKRRSKVEEDDDDDDDDDDEPPKKRRPKSKSSKPAAKKRSSTKPAKKSRSKVDDDDDDDDEPPKKRSSKSKSKSSKPAAKKRSSKTKSTSKKKKSTFDDDDDWDDED